MTVNKWPRNQYTGVGGGRYTSVGGGIYTGVGGGAHTPCANVSAAGAQAFGQKEAT